MGRKDQNCSHCQVSLLCWIEWLRNGSNSQKAFVIDNLAKYLATYETWAWTDIVIPLITKSSGETPIFRQRFGEKLIVVLNDLGVIKLSEENANAMFKLVRKMLIGKDDEISLVWKDVLLGILQQLSKDCVLAVIFCISLLNLVFERASNGGWFENDSFD